MAERALRDTEKAKRMAEEAGWQPGQYWSLEVDAERKQKLLEQVFALAEHASTASEQIRRELVPGGHLGLFMGHRSLHEYWPPVLRGVLAHSR